MTLRLRSSSAFWHTIAPLWLDEPAPFGTHDELLNLIEEELEERFGPKFAPKLHITPGQKLWAVRSGWELGHLSDAQDNYQLEPLPWHPSGRELTCDSMTSERWEEMGRTLLFVDAIYLLGEGQEVQRITLDDESTFALAGFWRPGSRGQSDAVELLHGPGDPLGFAPECLMPVMLPKNCWQGWLDPWSSQEQLVTMLRELSSPPAMVLPLAVMPQDEAVNQDTLQLDLVDFIEQASQAQVVEPKQLNLFGAAS